MPTLALSRAPHPGDRIGVLQISDRYDYGPERTVARTVQSDLRNELLDRGFQAFDARATYDELRRFEQGNADYYVEIVSSHSQHNPVGGVGVDVGAVGATVSVVVSRVAAEVRLYDGRTLEMIERYDLRSQNTAVLPTAVGVGGRHIFAFFAIPFMQYAQYRAAAHAVARDAAIRIAGR
jgi:hypothetical protein